MRFALVGSHPDGLDLAAALVTTGRHELLARTAAVPDSYRDALGSARQIGDLEEVLADPAVEAVIVAGPPADRPAQLRRALQSERHVLCIHPADESPDTGYEAALIQGDTKHVLMPILTEHRHPGVARLAELAREPDGPLGGGRLVELEYHARGEVLLEADTEGYGPCVPGWEVLRALGGEVAEVSAFAGPEAVEPGEPLFVAGRFAGGRLFHAAYLPGQPEAMRRVAVAGERGRAELRFPHGVPGPAFLTWRDPGGEEREEAWDVWDPWPQVIADFEAAVAGGTAAAWQEEVRCLELDDAARRSVERRRASTLEYPEASEEVGFKGTMTLIGCGLLWVILLLLILSYWFPMLRWAILAALPVFLLLQVLRWVVPGRREEGPGGRK